MFALPRETFPARLTQNGPFLGHYLQNKKRKESKWEKLSEECGLRGEGGSAHSENFSLLPDVHQLSVAAFPCLHVCCSVVSEGGVSVNQG